MASSNESTIAKAADNNTYYQNKQGTVIILTLDNYPQFEVIVVLVLIARGWWRIFTSQWTCRDENQDLWDQEAGKVIRLLNNCIIFAICLTFQLFLVLIANPISLWNYLKLYDTTINLILVNNLRKEFDDFTFNKLEAKIINRVLKL